jgi:hypothetical protein
MTRVDALDQDPTSQVGLVDSGLVRRQRRKVGKEDRMCSQTLTLINTRSSHMNQGLGWSGRHQRFDVD